MAFVVASDRWRRSDRPTPSTVSVSSSPSRTLVAALGWSVSKRRAALVHNSRSRSIIALHPEIRGPA